MNYTEIDNSINNIHKSVRNLYDEIYKTKSAPKKGFFDKPQGELTEDQFMKFNMRKDQLVQTLIKVVDQVAFKTMQINDKRFDIIKYKIQVIKYNLDDLDDVLSSVYSKYHLAAMSQIALISTIFLPLTFIVGWFGMNFNSMGAQKGNKGIFSITRGQLFVIVLCILSLSLFAVLFKVLDISV